MGSWGGANFAWADETIGNVDQGWESHVKEYTLAAGKSLTINFTVNSTKQTQNYQGWVTQVLNGSDMIFFMQPSCGYAVISDGEWNWSSNTASYNANSYKWDGTNFIDNLQGASVNYNIKRVGNNIVLTEIVTTTSTAPTANTTFWHYFVFPYSSSADLTVKLGADAAVLTVGDATTTDSETLPTVYGTLVGNEVNGTPWWTAFADYTITADETKTVYFKNYSSKLENYHNWILGLTSDADRGSSTEYLILRADNNGWGTKYSSGTLTSNYNWSTFRDELDGATVKMNVARSGGTVTVTATQIAATDGTTVRTETFTFTDETLASDAMRFFLTTEGGHLDILPECTITLTSNNDSYGTAAVTSTAFGDGVVPAGTAVTVTATAAEGYVINGWKNGEEYVSRNSTYTFTATGNTSLQAEFVAMKTSWDFTSATWSKASGIDYSKSVTVNTSPCYYANGDLAGLALDNSGGTAWMVNGSLWQGNGTRKIGILNCTAGQLVTITTTNNLSNPDNGTLIGTATTGTVHYRVTNDGTFGFNTDRSEKNNPRSITSISVTDMDYSILYAGDKEAYDTKVAALDAAGQAYWNNYVTAADDVATESEYNTAVAELPTIYMAAVKAQTTPNADMTDAVENASCTGGYSAKAFDYGSNVVSTGWTINNGVTVDNFHINAWSTEAVEPAAPFTEYFQSYESNGNLSDATISHDQITGLRAGTYSLSGTIRLWSDSGNESLSGATLFANGETVAIAGTGTSYGDSKYYVTTANVTFTVSEAGTLDFGITVKDANFNWVAFKNFTLTLVSLASVPATVNPNGYSTFASPYALDLENLPEGLTAYQAHYDNDNKYIVRLSEVKEAVVANTGLLLKGATSTTGTTYNIPVAATGNDISETNDFEVNENGMTFTAEDDYYYFGLKKSELLFALFDPATVAIPSNKAYLKLLKSNFTTGEARLTLMFDDSTTGINTLHNNDEENASNPVIYNLNGQRVSKPTKGLYIINGKKTIVR